MAGVVLYEVIDDAPQEDDEGVSHNVLPLKAWEVIVPVLVYLASYHDGEDKRTYKYTDKQPTGETDEVAPVEGDEVSEKGLHTQSQYVKYTSMKPAISAQYQGL